MSSRKLALPNYKAEYRLRVLARIYEKSKGKEIVIDTAPPRSTPADRLMEALKRGME